MPAHECDEGRRDYGPTKSQTDGKYASLSGLDFTGYVARASPNMPGDKSSLTVKHTTSTSWTDDWIGNHKDTA